MWHVPGEVIGKEEQEEIWRESVLKRLEKKWKKARKKAEQKIIDENYAAYLKGKADREAAEKAAKKAANAKVNAAKLKKQQGDAAKRQRQRKRDAKAAAKAAKAAANPKIIGKRKNKIILKPWKSTHTGNGHELHHYTGAQLKKVLYDFNNTQDDKKDKYPDMRNMTKSKMLTILRRDFSTNATNTHITLKHRNGHTTKIKYTKDVRSGGGKKKKVTGARKWKSNQAAFKKHGYVPGGARG